MYCIKNMLALLVLLISNSYSEESEGHFLRCQAKELVVDGAVQRVYTIPQGGNLYYRSDPNCSMYDRLCDRDRKALFKQESWFNYLVQLGFKNNTSLSELCVEGLAMHSGMYGYLFAEANVDKIELLSDLYDFRNETYGPVVDRIAAFQDLKYLDLYQSNMTRENFDKLTGLSNLTYLGLPYASNDDYLSVAAKFKKLRYLNASWTKILGYGWCDLKALPELEILDLRGNQFRNYNIGQFNSLNLKTLLFAHTNITDRDLFFMGLPNLVHLELHDTPITDRGLGHLGWHKKLKYLTVYDTQVTSEGVEALKQKLPGLTVVTEWDKETDVKMRDQFIDYKKKQKAESTLPIGADSGGPKNRPKYKEIPWEEQPLYQYIIEVDTDVDYPIIFEKEDK